MRQIEARTESRALRKEIEATRPPRNSVDFSRPLAAWVEREPDGHGGTAAVASLILTASECPWRCTMCDLWKHTANTPTPAGAIPRQIEHALSELSCNASWIKLYNSGSFFDKRSIPPIDYPAIARLCKSFDRVIIENHPKLCSDNIHSFSKLLNGKLEIALGVETLQPGMLRRLNKGMNRDDIDQAVSVHRRLGVDTRAFLLIRPPWTLDAEAVVWTTLTVRHMARLGVRHCSLIPVRAGNGYMDQLAAQDIFHPPSLATIEQTFDDSMQIKKQMVVTLDLWNWPTAKSGEPTKTNMDLPDDFCEHCASSRKARLEQMNLVQTCLPRVHCAYCQASTCQ